MKGKAKLTSKIIFPSVSFPFSPKFTKGVWLIKYNNNAVFAGIIDIYGPHFFIKGPPRGDNTQHSNTFYGRKIEIKVETKML